MAGRYEAFRIDPDWAIRKVSLFRPVYVLK